MDEDDAVAILTRRLIIEHDFFVWQGKADTSPLLKTQGKNLRSADSYFTTLQTLYNINETLLLTPERDHLGFSTREYKQFRPPEEDLDGMFNDLMLYWNAILAEMDVLHKEPQKMREHDSDLENTEGVADNLLFWPIGQELFADVMRILLNRRLPDPGAPSESDVRACIRVLAEIEWDLRRPPWAGLLLIEDPDQSKDRRRRMRNEDRKRAVEVAKRILLFQVGIDDSMESLADLKIEWYAMLMPRPEREEVDAIWDVIMKAVR